MSSVSIVIVNWNTGKLLASCIASILSLPEYDQVRHVVVIDNRSSDTSFTEAKKQFGNDKKVSFVYSGENLGFARATNIGIRRLGKLNTNHVLLLNPDTELDRGSLQAQLNALESEATIGIVGPRLVNPDRSLQPSVRMFPSTTAMLMLSLKLQHFFPQARAWQQYMAANFDYDKQQIVDQVMGACFLIRREALNDIGLLDERFWVWFEEVDFCKRAASAGWKTVYTPTGTVVHYGGASFHQLVGLKKSLPFMQSALLYSAKHLPLPTTLLLYALTPVTILFALLAAVRHRVVQEENMKRL